ncbi:MAG: hypothetical protein ACOYNO_12490, partial [Saprospiraceae bacterium]
QAPKLLRFYILRFCGFAVLFFKFFKSSTVFMSLFMASLLFDAVVADIWPRQRRKNMHQSPFHPQNAAQL